MKNPDRLYSVFQDCNSNKVIESIFKIHFPNANNIIDMTWGKGVFWNKWNHPYVVGIDLNPQKTGQTLCADSTALPFKDDSFDVAVVDPPFIDVSKHSTITRFTSQYEVQRNGSGQSAITELYEGMIHEASRVAWAVIVKGKDTISSRKYIPRYALTYNTLQQEGYIQVDLAFLVARTVSPDNWKTVEHFRRRESFFIVAVRGRDYKRYMKDKF